MTYIDRSSLSAKARSASIEEARSLVKRCAGTSPAGEVIKGAVRRAAHRLQFSFGRTKDIWYGDARRIDAKEMDRLRLVAEETEISQAVSAIETLIGKLRESTSPDTQGVTAGLEEALQAIGSILAASSD